MMTLLCFFSL
jgi:hypothetical protein